MSSPVKKRKLNTGAKTGAVVSKGLEYFFARQRGTQPLPVGSEAPDRVEQVASDEELARRLQAEWAQENRTGGSYVASTGEQRPNETQAKSKVQTDSSASQFIRPSPSPPEPGTHTPRKGFLSLSSAGAIEDEETATLPLDQTPLVFKPAAHIPALHAAWAAHNGHASYALLTRCFVLINATTSRIKIVDTLTNCLRLFIEGDPSSLIPAVWLATNSISPPYISMELGLGGSAISKALKKVCGLDGRSLKAMSDRLGDPGDVAFEAKRKQSFTLRKPRPLTVKGVHEALVKISGTQGQGSGEVKQRIVDRLLQDARGGEESRFIVRTLCQHLRIGAVKTTMLIALSRAFLLSCPPHANRVALEPEQLFLLKKEDLAGIWSKAEELVKASFARHPNYDDLISALLEVGVCDELLVRCGLTLHVPLRPMLGSITRDLAEMLNKLQGRDFACEYKYDGQRAQIHRDAGGKVSIFSRHLQTLTEKYPDLVALVPQICSHDVMSFVLEGEVCAVDAASGELKTFQTLTNRARKDVALGNITIQVCLFAFDLMYLNGQPLLDRPFRERRALLRSLFVEVPNRFTWVKSLDAMSEDGEHVLGFFQNAVESKCEGIMVKILDNLPEMEYTGADDDAAAHDKPIKNAAGPRRKGKTQSGDAIGLKPSRRKPLLATYEPDKRLDSWLKVKKDYQSSFDTLDLVPVAAWHGTGRKAKWWSPILLAVRNESTGSLDVVCKCMSGFTDTFYKANRAFYDDGDSTEDGERKNTRPTKPGFVEYYGPEPDVWFEPQEVWEMAFADVTISPTYTAAIGLVREDRGLSLRFPRFLRKRDDKGMDEASSSQVLADLWMTQEAKGQGRQKDDGHDKDEGREGVDEDDDDDEREREELVEEEGARGSLTTSLQSVKH